MALPLYVEQCDSFCFGGIARITGNCVQCGEEVTLEMTLIEYLVARSPNRPAIQEIWPDKTPDEREFLKSGICGKCWANMFGGMDEDGMDENG